MAPQHPRDPVAEGLAEAEQSVRQEIDDNTTEDAKGRPQVPRSYIERDTARTRKREILALLQKLKLATQPLQLRLLVYLALIERGFHFLEQAIALHAKTRSAQQRYSPETRDAQKDALEAFNANRKRIARLGSSELAKGIKRACSVNETVTATDPAIEFSDRCTAMLESLSDKKHAALFKSRDIDPEILIDRLKPKAANLKTELDQGVSVDLKRGEASEGVYWALYFLEIALERTIGFLLDLELVKEAESLRARIPRRHEGRRATDVKPDPNAEPEPEPEDGKEPTDPEEPVEETLASEAETNNSTKYGKAPKATPAGKGADAGKGARPGKGTPPPKRGNGAGPAKPGTGGKPAREPPTPVPEDEAEAADEEEEEAVAES